jgi:hypothetical protein
LIEVPHGATRTRDYESLRSELRGPFPERLVEFFHVNTDVGAPEVAERVARGFVGAHPTGVVVTVRARVPRTFVDLNRVVGPGTVPASSAPGAMTPGIGPWVTDAGDVRLLRDRHATYHDLVERALAAVVAPGGTALLLHTFAPRSVDVAVDERIVERLREAYLPENVERWPLRAEVDLITRDPDGRRVTADRLVEAMRRACERAGLTPAESGAYALHPASVAASIAARWPDRTVCVEIRRDLLVRSFEPFREMEVDPAKAERIAAVLVEGLSGRS